MSLKHNETYTVDDDSPKSDYYSPPNCDRPRSPEDHSSKKLADQHLNGTFIFNLGDRSQPCNSACNPQKSSSCVISSDGIGPTPSPKDPYSCRAEVDSSPRDKSSTAFNLNEAFISLSSYFRPCQSQNSTDSAVEKCQSCQESSAHAIHSCEAVYSESHQLLSTYTIGSGASRSGQSSQLLSTYTIDSHAYTCTTDASGIEIFQNCSDRQSSQSEEKGHYESKVALSDQLPNASRTKSSNLTSHNQSANCASSSSSSFKSCSDQFELTQRNQFSKACLKDVKKTNETNHSQSCLEKNQTGKYQCCEHSEKSAIDFCSDSNNCNFPCANSVVKKIASKTFLVEKSDCGKSQSQPPSPSSESFKEKRDFNSDTKSVVNSNVVVGSTGGASSKDAHDKHCSGTSKYDAISARLLELFTKGTTTTGKCSCCPVIPLNSSKMAMDSKLVSLKPGNECDKSNEDPKSSSTNCSGKSPLSKDLFSSAEFMAELENAERKMKFSPCLSQDSLFFITSQGKAYHHFEAKLEKQGNVQSSTQGNCKERLGVDARRSSSETQFSPLDNEVDEKKSPHFRNENEVAAKIETSSFPDASPSKPALPLSEQKSDGTVDTPPASERDSMIVNIPESLVPISEAGPQLISEVSNQSVMSAQSSNVAPLSSKKTSPSKAHRSKPIRGFTSPNSSLCTVVEVEPESARKQNKHTINQDVSEVTCSEKETAVSALNTAYIAEEAVGVEDASIRQKKISLQRNKIQSFRKFRKKKRFSQNLQRSSSVAVSSGEMSKPSNQTSSSSKTRSSSTNTSSCIIESSIVNPLKKFKNKTNIRGSNCRENNTPRRKRRQRFRRHKIVPPRKMKRQAAKATNSSLSTVYSSLNSNSGQAIEVTEARKIDTVPEFIDLAADPEQKLPRPKRRSLFKKFKILQRRRNRRQAEKNWRNKVRRKSAPNAKCTEPKLPSEPSCIINKTSHSSSSSVSVIETSVPNNLVIRNNRTIRETPASSKTILNESCALSPKRSQGKLASETSTPEHLPLNHNQTMEEGIIAIGNEKVSNESCTSSPKRSQGKLTPETLMPDNLPLNHDGTIKVGKVTDRNKSVSNESCASSPRRSQRKLTPETSMSSDPSSSHNGPIKNRKVTDSNKTVLNKSCASSPRRSQRNLTPDTSMCNDRPLSHDGTVKDRIVTVSNKSVLNESCSGLRRSQRLTPETSTPTDPPSSCDGRSTVSNKTILNESCASSLRRSQRKLTPETSMPSEPPWSQDDVIKNRTFTVINKTVLNESCASSLRRSQRKRTPETSLPNEHSLSHEGTIRSRSVSTSKKTVSNESVSSNPRRSDRKCTPVEPSVTPKQQIVRLGSLNYFCINVRALSQDFLEFHGFLPKLCLQRVAVQGIKRKRVVSDCYVLLEDCMGGKNHSPSYKTCSFSISPKRRKIGSPPSETLSFFSNPKKRISLSSSKKDGAVGSESRSSCQQPAENPDKAPSEADFDQITCNSKEEKQNCDLTEKDEACSSSGVDTNSAKLTEDVGVKSVPLESSLSVKACLMQISPRISENIVSAVCCHCSNLIPYGLTETEFAAGGALWPNNMTPMCPSANCNRRKLYWGIFKTQLVLKTQNGEYLIAQTTTPDAENFFGCTVREFFEDAEHEKRIKERIAQLLVSQKKQEDIIFKNYNLIVHQSKDALRIRIVNTNLFDP